MTKKRKVAVVAGLAVVVVVLVALPIMKNVEEQRESETASDRGREDGRAVAVLMMGEVLRNIEFDALVGGPEALTIASLRTSVPSLLEEQFGRYSHLHHGGTQAEQEFWLESLRNVPQFWPALSADPYEGSNTGSYTSGFFAGIHNVYLETHYVLETQVLDLDNPRNSLRPARFTLGPHGDEEEQEIKLLTEVSDSEMEEKGLNDFGSETSAAVQQAVGRLVHGVNRLILDLPDCTGTSC